MQDAIREWLCAVELLTWRHMLQNDPTLSMYACFIGFSQIEFAPPFTLTYRG